MLSKTKSLFKESWNECKSNLKYYMYAIGFDLVFLMLYGFITSAYQNKIFQYVQAIGAVGISAQGVKNSASPTFVGILFNNQTSGYFLLIMVLLLLLLVSLYLIFNFIGGIGLYLSFNLGEFNKKNMLSYIKDLFFISIPFFIILAFDSIISFYFYYMDFARETVGLGKGWFGYIHPVFTLLLFYFIFIAVLLKKKNNFKSALKMGGKKFHKIFPLYLFLMILFLILGSVMLIPFISGNLFILRLYSVFILLGFIVYSKVIMKNYLKKVE